MHYDIFISYLKFILKIYHLNTLNRKTLVNGLYLEHSYPFWFELHWVDSITLMKNYNKKNYFT